VQKGAHVEEIVNEGVTNPKGLVKWQYIETSYGVKSTSKRIITYS